MTEQRRLAAILVADVVGHSRLMGPDESGTLVRLQRLDKTGVGKLDKKILREKYPSV